MPLKIATWNVNSIRARLGRVTAWLERQQPDVACFQETKVTDAEFPYAELEALGYRCLVNGQKSYNGVAIVSRTPIDAPLLALHDDEAGADRRLLAAIVAGIRIINVYAPNGQAVGTDKYRFKLDWYKRLRTFLDLTCDPAKPVLLCGDLNIAPEDRDVWDPLRWRGRILFSEPEKDALREIMVWGFTDALRLHHPEPNLYSWWDYREGSFHRNWGLRIDHILVSAPLVSRCLDVTIDREERKGDKPSDHAPVIATFAS